MMCANNLLNTVLTLGYLGASPYLAHTGMGEWVGLDLTAGGSGGEVGAALGFMGRHPGVWRDVLGFAICGAVGQVFICKFFQKSINHSLDIFDLNPPSSLSFGKKKKKKNFIFFI